MNLSNLAALQTQAVIIITSFHAAIFCTGFLEIGYSEDITNCQPSHKAWLPNHLWIYFIEESLSDLVNIICLRNLCSFLQLARPPTQLRGMLFKPKLLQVFPPTLMFWIWEWCKSLWLAFISIHSWSGLVSCTERTGFSLFYSVLAWTLSPSASFEIILHVIGGDLPSCKGFKYLWLGTGRLPVYHNNFQAGWKASLIFTWGTEKWKVFLHYTVQNVYFFIYTYTHTIKYMPLICD